MHLAVHSWDISFDQGDNTAGVQMSPLAPAVIVRRTFLTAFRA
jgi:hypothetical protein